MLVVIQISDFRMLVEILSRLQAIYTEGTISVGGRNYTGESQVKSLMAESRNYSLLLQVWTDWRKAVGPPSRKLFRRMIEIGNMGARAAGQYAQHSTLIKPVKPDEHLIARLS